MVRSTVSMPTGTGTLIVSLATADGVLLHPLPGRLHPASPGLIGLGEELRAQLAPEAEPTGAREDPGRRD